ncbi:MAG: response regulator [Gammaproteobacteria bacterium]|nr:response regulator [Gammaproteobacteria bacterium]
MIKIAIISHQTLLRQSVKTLLHNPPDMAVIAEINIDQSAICQLDTLQPDVTILQNDSTYIKWFQCLQQIMRIVPTTRLLILAAQNETVFPSRLLKAGAAGYLTQHHSPAELINAIRAVTAGHQYLSPKVASQVMLDHLDKDPSNHPFDSLSDRELEIAYHLANGGSTEEIAKAVYLSPSTINCYRYRLLKRLKLENTTALTYLAAKHHLIDLPYIPPEQEGSL